MNLRKDEKKSRNLSDPILIIPCSGIGKPFGTVSREATYCVVEDLRKGQTGTICLSLLVMNDKNAVRKVRSSRCIAVDGCPNECAKKTLELSDAKLVGNFRVVDILRDHRDLRPKGITFLDEDGRKLAKILAEKIAPKIDDLANRGILS